MVLSVSFVVVVAVLAAGIGRFVVLPVPEPDVEPRFARDVARGLTLLWWAGRAHAERLDHYVEAMSGRHATQPGRQPQP